MLHRPDHGLLLIIFLRFYSGLKKYGLCILVGVCLMLFSGCMEVTVGGRKRPLIKHKRIRGEIELVAEREKDTQDSTTTDRKSKTVVFEERLRLRTEGDVYHPNLMTYTAALGFGLVQHDLESSDLSGKTSDSLHDYSVTALAFKGKPYPISMYTSKSDSISSRHFRGSLRSENESFGFGITLKNKSWPMRFQYSKNESTQDSLSSTQNVRGRDFFMRIEERFRYSLSHNFTQLSRMKFDFEREDRTNKRLSSSTNSIEDLYRLSHDLIFGDDKQYKLDSLLSFSDVTSRTSSQERTKLVERLLLEHTPNFETRYKFDFSENKRKTSNSEQTRLEGGFRHKLYKSLITSGQIFLSESKTGSSSKRDREGGYILFDYRKQNPFGTLIASYKNSITKTEQSGGAGAIETVEDESHLAVNALIELDRTNIDISTIVVKNASGAGVEYQLNEDYTVSETDGRVFLKLILNGGLVPDFIILDGTVTFFVDYNFEIDPKREETVNRQDFSLRQKLRNGISLYYRHSQQNETIKSNEVGVTPDEMQMDLYGISFRRKSLSIYAEQEKEDSTQIDSEVQRLRANYGLLINANTRVNLYAFKEIINFKQRNTSNELDSFTFGGDLVSRLTNKIDLDIGFDYMVDKNKNTGKTTGIQFSSNLRYKFRQLRVLTGIEYDILSRKNNETENIRLFCRVKRFF